METSIKFFYFFLLINIALATPKIIGGRPANITEVPYQLELDWNSHHRCGAAIVGSQFAITAAHCFDDVTNNSVILRAGSANLEQGDIYSIQQYLINHDYVTWPNGIPDNDIAFIVVDRPFKLSDSVQIVKIAEVEPYDSEVGIVSGWGVTEDGGTIHSDILLSVEIPIVNRDACYDLYRRNITASMICAGKEGSGVCGGDSGGPLVVNGTLVGIVSWGFHCAVNYPGVFTNVAYFKNWIDEQINL